MSSPRIVHKGHALIGAITGIHLAAIVIAGLFLVFGVKAIYAQAPVVDDLCWSREECLVVAEARGNCDQQHCFEAGGRDCPNAGTGKCYANPPPVQLSVRIGSATRVLDAGDYIAKVYNYAVGIAALIAGVMFVVGGFFYLTAGGDAARVSKAKDRIKDAIIGLLLVLGAYAILNTINPDTLRLQMPKIPIVKKREFVACEYFSLMVKCGDPFKLVRNQNPPPDAGPEARYHVATEEELRSGVSTSQTCYGMSCSKAGLSDGDYRCRRNPEDRTQLPTSTSQCGQAPQAPFQCVTCSGWIEDCSAIGRTSQCCTGFCGSDTGAMVTDLVSVGGYSISNAMGNGTCTNGENGVTCQNGPQCKSGICQTRLKNRCSSGLTGAACDSDRECRDGRICVSRHGIYVCVPPTVGGYCDATSDCPDGTFCGDARCKPRTFADGSNVPSDWQCSSDADCDQWSTRFAMPLFCNDHHGRKSCSQRTNGSPCRRDQAGDEDGGGCYNPSTGYRGTCVNVVTDCTNGSIANTVAGWVGLGSGTQARPGVCTGEWVGEACNSDSDCDAHGQGRCYYDDVGPAVDSAIAGASDMCTNGIGFCVTGLPGSGCNPAHGNNCAPGYSCSERAHMCFAAPGCP